MAKSQFYELNFLSHQPKIPQYNKVKALNTTESKLKN